MIEFLFLDLDDTILDFKKAERIAVRRAISNAGVEATDEVCSRYSEINLLHWQMLERGEITREQVLVNRFAVLFEELGHSVHAEKVARDYERLLGIGHYFLPGAEETVKRVLFGNYRMFLASNGTAGVQRSRLTSADLYPYFEKIFISEDIGYNKPSREYFDGCFRQIPDFDASKALMVGDSLSSDILGGINAGVKTCWVNPRGNTAPDHIQPDYIIGSITELPPLLETI